MSRAAERIDLSQPAMSNTLRRLRVLLDDQLLVRSGNHMVPTPRALEIHPVVGNALEELGSALFGTTDLDPRNHTAPITIATTYGALKIWRPLALPVARGRRSSSTTLHQS